MAPATSLRHKVPLVALAAALVIGCQPSVSPAPSDSPGASAWGQASAGASPTPTPGPPNIVWADQPFAEIVTAVNVDQGQFVAVGGTSTGLASWTSADGVAWTKYAAPAPTMQQLGLDPLIFGTWGPAPAMMGRMARFGDTLISIGTFFGPNDYLRPIGWRTTDLMTWEFIESTNPFFTDGYAAMDLVGSEDELVAVNHGFGLYSGGAWRWTPATSWVQTTPTNTEYTQSSVDILDAVWAGGQFVAVGERAVGSAVSWVSTDGQAWQESPAAPQLSGGIMRSVAAAPGGGFVAVGDVAGIPTAWTSADGLSWASVTLPGGGPRRCMGLWHSAAACWRSATRAPAR